MFVVVNWTRPQLFCGRCVNIGSKIDYCGDNGRDTSHRNGSENNTNQNEKKGGGNTASKDEILVTQGGALHSHTQCGAGSCGRLTPFLLTHRI